MKKNKKIWIIIFKIIIVSLSYIYIINRFRAFEFTSLFEPSFRFFSLIFFTAILMCINWSLEALKWQILIKKIEQISFFNSLKSILVSLVFGLFTPNRIGEIGGRAIYLSAGNRTKGVVAAGIGSFAQMTVTVVFGLFGFGLIFFFFGAFNLNDKTVKILGIILFLTAVLMIFIFFRLDIFIKLLQTFKVKQKFIDKINLSNNYSQKKLIKILCISSLRYIVFVSQYYILLRVFDVNINFFIAISSILSIFLLMNVLPNIVIVDLGIRGSVAIFILGQFSENLQGILSASVFLWLINILIPAVMGQILFLTNDNSIHR